MLEIEKRYKVNNVETVLQKLQNEGVTLLSKKRVIDEWYAPLDVQSHERQKQWFDEEHGVAYRIRQTQTGEEPPRTEVESKQLTSDNNHDTFHETVLPIVNYEEAKRVLEAKGYWNWLTIDKTRYVFESGDTEVEVVLDEIAGVAKKIGVGAALELEYKGNLDREGALEKLRRFATKLGLGDDLLFEKSFTVEAMQVLAKF